MISIAVTDDWQNIAPQCADWSALNGRATVRFYTRPLGSEDAAATELAPYDIIIPMRERLSFPTSLLQRLPRLRMLALTGMGLRHVDVAYCNRQGIVCTGSGLYSPAATAELALGLMIAAARHIASGDAAIRGGGFQEHTPLGLGLAGRTLGVIGMGRIGTQMAAYGKALGMRVIGWGRSFDAARAAGTAAEAVDKETLLRHADAVSIHLTYSEQTRDFLGAAELALLKPGTIVINTSRGPIINEAALLQALTARRLIAALDVFDVEPLPADHPLRRAPNTVLTPHLGFNTRDTFEAFYRQSIENILGFLQRQPARVLNPESVAQARWLD